MRQSALLPSQARILANLMRGRRVALDMSMRAVCRRANCNVATLSALESASILSPSLETLRNLTQALDLPMSDVFGALGWLPAADLPTIQPYLRSKYRDLSDAEIRAIGAYTEQLLSHHEATPPNNP